MSLPPRRAPRGFTLVELVTSIVIFSVATIRLMLAVSASMGRSADPMVEIQATAIAKAYLDSMERYDWFDISLAAEDSQIQLEQLKDGLSRMRDEFDQAFEGKRKKLTQGDELKLVFPQAGAEPERFAGLAFRHFFLQPMDGPKRAENTAAAADFCMANPQWRLSLQTHKLIGIP